MSRNRDSDPITSAECRPVPRSVADPGVAPPTAPGFSRIPPPSPCERAESNP